MQCQRHWFKQNLKPTTLWVTERTPHRCIGFQDISGLCFKVALLQVKRVSLCDFQGLGMEDNRLYWNDYESKTQQEEKPLRAVVVIKQTVPSPESS